MKDREMTKAATTAITDAVKNAFATTGQTIRNSQALRIASAILGYRNDNAMTAAARQSAAGMPAHRAPMAAPDTRTIMEISPDHILILGPARAQTAYMDPLTAETFTVELTDRPALHTASHGESYILLPPTSHTRRKVLAQACTYNAVITHKYGVTLLTSEDGTQTTLNASIRAWMAPYLSSSQKDPELSDEELFSDYFENAGENLDIISPETPFSMKAALRTANARNATKNAIQTRPIQDEANGLIFNPDTLLGSDTLDGIIMIETVDPELSHLYVNIRPLLLSASPERISSQFDSEDSEGIDFISFIREHIEQRIITQYTGYFDISTNLECMITNNADEPKTVIPYVTDGCLNYLNSLLSPNMKITYMKEWTQAHLDDIIRNNRAEYDRQISLWIESTNQSRSILSEQLATLTREVILPTETF